MQFRCFFVLVLALSFFGASYAHADNDDAAQDTSRKTSPRRTQTVPCPTNARAITADPGDTHRVRCPANCKGPLVWGSDIYADDSAICVAARHAGAYDGSQDTTITIEFLPGQKGYRGSTQNGITTFHWGTWPRSFRVQTQDDDSASSLRARHAATPMVAAPAQAETPPPSKAEGRRNQAVDCSLRGDELPGEVGARRTIRCPSGCNDESVWGEGPYTDDSSVCAAAIHAGAIPEDEGGLVRVHTEGPLRNAKANKAHGIQTQAWRFWPRSFRIEAVR